MVQTIKILIALTGLALLSACWGLKRPSPVTSTIELCTTNPFQNSCNEDYEIERIVKITECIAGGAAATLTCEDAVGANSCIRDPFVTTCATDDKFAPYLTRARNERVTYCATDTADVTLCASVAGSIQLDNECLDSLVDAPAYPSCDSRPSVVRICADDPFTRPGCGNVSTIDALRIAHCDDPLTAWDDDCVEATYAGAVLARNTACLEYGIDAGAGGHADCAMRGNVLAACGDNTLFAHDVCDAVEGNGVKQINACLANVDADDGCEARIMQTCEDTPLAGVGCAGLDGHSGFLDVFCAKDDNAMLGGCATTPAGLCFADPFGDMVTDGDGMIDCLADDAYDSARQARCAAGTEGAGDCDTAVIAPEVCASSGANANPFAGFCTGTNNIGVGTIAGIRQAVVTLCLNNGNPAMAVCQNTDTLITALTAGPTRCELIGHAFTDRCVYTQFETSRRGICTTENTAWNDGCNNEATYSGTAAMRDAACLQPQDPSVNNVGSCGARQSVITKCTTPTPAPDSKIRPFLYTICDKVAANTINPLRKTYCELPVNAWTDDCTEALYDNHDRATAQGRACVMFGIDTNLGGHASCTTNQEAKNFCGMPSNNPLADANSGCRVLENFAAIVGVYCVANPQIPACKVDSAAWTGSFTTSLATAPNSNHTANQFLSGLTATALTGFTFLTTTEENGQKANATTSLTLADTDHGFGGEADDGVAFYGAIFSGNIRYYAGIYSSTDLGAPLTSVSQNGVWRAWIRTSGKDPDNESFMLTVDFNATTAMGTLKAFFQSTSGANTALYYDINGRFGINGVITGSVAIGTEDSGSLDTEDNDYTLGRLTGLIGADGVVAAFVSNTNTITADGNGNGTNPFVGGFVGVPTVAYDDWDVVASPDAAVSSTLANQFLQYSAGGSLDAVAVNLKDATYNGNPLNGDNMDSFAYNTAGTSPDFVYYVVISPTTDLGAPLNDVAQAGAWNGSFVSVEGGTETAAAADFILTVTFGATSKGNAGSVAATIENTLYSLEGEFDARGVIIGTITHTVTSPAEVISMGTLQGLIGQDGAVGVFISNSDASMDYGGGFVARKP